MRAVLLASAFLFAATSIAAASGYSELNAGIAATLRRDNEQAIQQLTLAIAAPDLPARFLPLAHYDRAGAYFDEEQYKSAIADCDAALALRPDWYDARILRARSFAVEEHFAEALSDVSAAIAARPDLPWGLTSRAGIHLRQHDYRAAIGDDTQAIALDPISTGPLLSRALAYDFAGEYDLALDDHLAARALLAEPHNLDLSVGVAQWLVGHNEDALADFQSAATQDPDSRFPLLWEVIAQSASDSAVTDLAKSAMRVDLTQWPGPIASFYLGKASLNDVIAAARIADPGESRDRKCEADFYLAEWQLLHHSTAGVREMLTAASDECPYSFIELIAAKRELQRLEVTHGGS